MTPTMLLWALLGGTAIAACIFFGFLKWSFHKRFKRDGSPAPSGEQHAAEG